ncbi:MAG: hypothetical protein KC917_05040 [Candidatus Omnitrophica bacterium]|nr:hypothetical protein [Candidatus Omnitrophota bacterium]MCA9424564.1 hypothetical protein [Candidatus Omnitrophota bacterium]MCB9767710.1 hypothetical protein [Candidatus Omnitrophota bacterium]MCB9782356.1 hypothetical protein [Candidatus Omnitrophota bacterium]
MLTGLAKSRVKKVLDQFEETTLVPIVPGEGEKWCVSVAKSIETTHEEIKRTLEEHQDAYARILDEDPGLSARVRELRGKESESVEQLIAFLGKTQFAEARVKQTSENSWEPTTDLEVLRGDILDWITTTRALHEEIETWYVEAFYRERGEPG